LAFGSELPARRCCAVLTETAEAGGGIAAVVRDLFSGLRAEADGGIAAVQRLQRSF
jgi:hypothetical protein